MTPRILVVDDEPDVQDLIKRRFRKQIRTGEFEFDFALDGQEALECIAENGAFDIVLSDINMPRMDGLTLLKHLREHPGIMKTIIVSAYGDMENIRTAMNRGAFDFITKPINFDDLLATIEKSLEELRFVKNLIERMTEAEATKQYMASELDIGRTIQGGFLPTQTPKIEGWNISPYLQGAREVAGDFYDVFTIAGHNRVGLIVADVCDKGVGAALFMTLFRSLLRSTAKLHEYADTTESSRALYLEKPELLLKRCVQFTNNYVAATHGHTSMFATLFFGLLDPETGHLYYISAGHEETLVARPGGVMTRLETTGPVVGLFRDTDFRVGETRLEIGDTLVAYTDGVSDAVDPQGDPFTQERLTTLLAGLAANDDHTQTIVRELKAHMGDTAPFDDVTILTVTRKQAR